MLQVYVYIRMCVRFRGLNEQSVQKCYPLPRTHELFEELQGASVFDSIDLHMIWSGWSQKVCLRWFWLLQLGCMNWFRALCYGVSIAAYTLQNIANDVLIVMIGKLVVVDLHNIGTYSRDRGDHMCVWTLCWSCCGDTSHRSDIRQTIQLSQTDLCCRGKWHADSPWSHKFFHKCIMNYARIVAPVQQLTKEDKAYSRTEACGAALTEATNASCSSYGLTSAWSFAHLACEGQSAKQDHVELSALANHSNCSHNGRRYLMPCCDQPFNKLLPSAAQHRFQKRLVPCNFDGNTLCWSPKADVVQWLGQQKRTAESAAKKHHHKSSSNKYRTHFGGDINCRQ